jgi:hypothetical protein
LFEILNIQIFFFTDVYEATVVPVKERVMMMLGRSGTLHMDTELRDLGGGQPDGVKEIRSNINWGFDYRESSPI